MKEKEKNKINSGDNNNSSFSGINYNGRVTISYLRGKQVIKKYHIKNSGTPLFFKLMANCVIGSNVSESMPLYLDAMVEGGKSGLSRRVSISGKLLVTDNGNTLAKFTINIPPQVVASEYSSSKIAEIGLHNQYNGNNETTRLAFIDITNEGLNFNASYTLMIEWYMSFNDSVNTSGSGADLGASASSQQ